MFTGIVQGTAIVVASQKQGEGVEFALELGELGRGLEVGASIAVGGVCLTVTSVHETRVVVYAMVETIDKTTLGLLQVGDQVNIERSAKLGDEIGGHIMSGHVTGTVTISGLDTSSGDHVITLQVNPEWMAYLFPKGFVGLDGCSLTVVDVGPDWFTVHLIPETLRRTTFGSQRVGGHVNLEIDALTRAVVDTVRLSKKSL